MHMLTISISKYINMHIICGTPIRFQFQSTPPFCILIHLQAVLIRSQSEIFLSRYFYFWLPHYSVTAHMTVYTNPVPNPEHNPHPNPKIGNSECLTFRSHSQFPISWEFQVLPIALVILEVGNSENFASSEVVPCISCIVIYRTYS